MITELITMHSGIAMSIKDATWPQFPAKMWHFILAFQSRVLL